MTRRRLFWLVAFAAYVAAVALTFLLAAWFVGTAEAREAEPDSVGLAEPLTVGPLDPAFIRWGHRGLFVATEAGLLVDLQQTLDIKRHPGHWETNPILGKHPSDGEVYAFFGGLMLGHALAYALLPRRYSVALETVQLTVSIIATRHNAAMGLSVRF